MFDRRRFRVLVVLSDSFEIVVGQIVLPTFLYHGLGRLRHSHFNAVVVVDRLLHGL